MPETILIVDDSKLEREMLKFLLKDYNILEAFDGEECLRVLEEHDYNVDMVVLDLVMPKLDGIEVLKIRDKDVRFHDIPTIVLTGSDVKEDQIKSFELGANDYITKPFDKNVVLSRISNVLAAKRRFAKVTSSIETLRLKAELDQMTGIYNKVTTESIVKELLVEKSDSICAMLVIDVDNFKTVNDVEGHQIGDHTLCIIADALTNSFRKTDVVGRIGGDEFLVFMAGVAAEENARKKANELVELVKFKVNMSIPEYVTLSIGLAFAEKGITYEELFNRCDLALYGAKNSGKDKYVEYGINKNDDDEKDILAVLSRQRSIYSQVDSCAKEMFCCKIFNEMKLLKEHKPSIIFVDISQEEDDGLGILSQLSLILAGTTVPVFVICEEENLAQYKNALCMDFVVDLFTAPLELKRLKKKVEKYNAL